MKPIRPFAAFLLVLYPLIGVGALAQEASYKLDRMDAKLLELQRSVEEAAAREIVFEERRYFPFRKKPIELEGVLRLWNGVGVSIYYPEKKALVIADQKGVLMRRFSGNGSFQQKNAGRGEGDTVSLLKAAFEFDRAELQRLFDMDWRESGDEWTIVMVPLSEEEKTIETVTVSGTSSTVGKIVLVFGENRSIEILPEREYRKEAFSSEEREKFFRNADE